MDNQQEIEKSKRNFLSKENLEQLYLVEKLSDNEIGKMFNMSLGQVHRLRNKYCIKSIEPYQRHPKQELDQKEKEFLIGTLLGDGHLRARSAYPQLMLEQTTKHYEYVLWLREQVKDWIYDDKKELRQTRKIDKKNGKIYHSYPFSTICHPVFIEIYKMFYKNNKKTLDIDLIEKNFTKYSLAIWIMDDGTISKNRNIMICSHSFSKDENEALSKLIEKKFNISSKVLTSKHTKTISYYLSFNKINSIKLSSLIGDVVIPSMQYKILLISSETTKQSQK
jgi:hypothetical protein